MFYILWGEDPMLYGSIEQNKMNEWMNEWLCWNHELCLMDCDWEHLAPATFLMTSPSKTNFSCWISAPGHISTARVTRHLAANQAHVLQKLDTQVLVTEQEREERQVRRTINPYRTMPMWSFRHVWHLHYSPLIFRDNLLHTFHHFSLHTVLHYTNWRCKKHGTELSAHKAQHYSHRSE